VQQVLNSIYEYWYCTGCLTYEQILENNTQAGYSELVNIYVDSGVYVTNKDLYPEYRSLIKRIDHEYRKLILGMLKTQDPMGVAVDLRCLGVDHKRVIILVTA
jgi:hypothetical protein